MTGASRARIERWRTTRIAGEASGTMRFHAGRMAEILSECKKGLEAGAKTLDVIRSRTIEEGKGGFLGDLAGGVASDPASDVPIGIDAAVAPFDGALEPVAKAGGEMAEPAGTGPADQVQQAPPERVAGLARGLAERESLTGLPMDDGTCLVDGLRLSKREAMLVGQSWKLICHDAQKAPDGDWRTWLLMGGRGSGKTRAGAEWVHALATMDGPRSDLRIALVAETLGDAREVMIDGVSGICRIARDKRPEFEASRRRLVWPNGAMAQIFSSEDPESLRGPQFHHAWCDEAGKWKHADETYDMLQFGLRLGDQPRVLVTTTPRPVPLLKRLMTEPGTVTRRIATAENAENLSAGFLSAMRERYGGTRLGRQELDGELIADREDGLWKRGMLEALTLRQPLVSIGPLSRIVVAVDPPSAASARGSCCGIVAAGLDASGRAVVLADASVEGASPSGWANAALRTYRRFDADRIVAEVNQGGDMVTAVLRSADQTVPVSTVRATRGKWLRAEPVAALYEQGKVVHAGRFAELEDQMCDFGPDGLSGGRSPDRLDALVWALTALMLDARGEPRVRGV